MNIFSIPECRKWIPFSLLSMGRGASFSNYYREKKNLENLSLLAVPSSIWYSKFESVQILRSNFFSPNKHLSDHSTSLCLLVNFTSNLATLLAFFPKMRTFQKYKFYRMTLGLMWLLTCSHGKPRERTKKGVLVVHRSAILHAVRIHHGARARESSAGEILKLKNEVAMKVLSFQTLSIQCHQRRRAGAHDQTYELFHWLCRFRSSADFVLWLSAKKAEVKLMS